MGKSSPNIKALLIALAKWVSAKAICGCALMVALAAFAVTPSDISARAKLYLPMLKEEQVRWWPEMQTQSALGGQVEQESCISLKSKMCWNPHAQLRTSREQGVGLGQITRAFRADGSVRFDALAEMRAAHPQALGAWSWDKASLYDPRFQLRGLVLKDRQCWASIHAVPLAYERLAMSLVCYNAGAGRVISDRKVCEATAGCDPGIWFGNVENTSRLPNTPLGPGYGGRSARSISRAYPKDILTVKRLKYVTALEM